MIKQLSIRPTMLLHTHNFKSLLELSKGRKAVVDVGASQSMAYY